MTHENPHTQNQNQNHNQNKTPVSTNTPRRSNPARPLRIAVLPGDGIGRDIIPPALAALQAVRDKNTPPWEFTEYAIGGSAIDATGDALPPETLEGCSRADAVILGAVGGPQWDHLPPDQRPEIGGLLRLRQELDLYANIRPVQIYPALRDATPLKETLIDNVNILVFRELTGGLYFGERGRPLWFAHQKCRKLRPYKSLIVVIVVARRLPKPPRSLFVLLCSFNSPLGYYMLVVRGW